MGTLKWVYSDEEGDKLQQIIGVDDEAVLKKKNIYNKKLAEMIGSSIERSLNTLQSEEHDGTI